MAKSPHVVPPGLSALTPQLVAEDARALVGFLEKAFAATLVHAAPGPDGKGIMHGMLRIRDVNVFISDAGFTKATKANLFLYVPSVDETFAKATAAGAKVLAPVADMFWGDRWSMIEDPAGNVWQIATHLEDVAPEEMMKRMKAQAGPPK